MLLEVDNLQTHIRRRRDTVEAVGGVSLSIAAGETVGLVGESGSGKSMTGMSIMRLLPPGGHVVGGSIKLGGRDLLTLSETEMRQVRGSEIAIVFQDPMSSLNPTMTVGEQVAEPLVVHRPEMSRTALRNRCLELLTLVGIPRPLERLRAYPHHLSGGLRQRVVIAIALACEPKLLIADEPTTALDVTTQAQILSLLDDLKDRLGMGMLLITHDMGVIASHTHRVLVMYAGRIVEATDTETLFRTSRHRYTQALLEAMPDLRVRKGGILYSIPGAPPDLTSVPSNACRFAPRCRHAQPRCVNEEPLLTDEGSGHSFACFYPASELPPSTGIAIASTVPASANAPTARTGSAPDAAEGGSVGDPRADPLLVVDHAIKEFAVGGGLRRSGGSVKAVSDVSFAVAEGETFGLVGESGCGKSTIARLIASLEKIDGGAVRFDGEELAKLSSRELRTRRRDLQLVFQDPYSSLNPRMRVGSILREPLVSQRIGSRNERAKRVGEALAEVGLSKSAADLYPHEFSGGQRQRIGLARALILEPRLIVADEPVSALDVSIQSQVLNLMKRLQADRGLTYVLISHDLAVVRYLADRIGVMYMGQLVEVGPADEIYERPAHPYTAALLEAVPQHDHSSRRTKDETAPIRGELPSAISPPTGCRFHTRCPRAEDLCRQVAPDLRPFNLPTHEAACHFPLQAPLPEATRA